MQDHRREARDARPSRPRIVLEGLPQFDLTAEQKIRLEAMIERKRAEREAARRGEILEPLVKHRRRRAPGRGGRAAIAAQGWLTAGPARMAVACLSVVGMSLWGTVDFYRQSFDAPALPDVAAAAPMPIEQVQPLPQLASGAPLAMQASLRQESEEPSKLEVFTGRVPPGGTLIAELDERGVSEDRVREVMYALRPVFNYKSALPGDFFALEQRSTGELVSFEYQRGRDFYRITPSEDGRLIATHSEPPMESRVVNLGGVIETSLYDSLKEQGERPELVQDFADIFIWTFDFNKESRPGDEYRLIYEKYYDRSGFVRYGKILAAQYVSGNQNQLLTALYYEDSNGIGSYYTPEGVSLKRTLLRAPLKYTRISSHYTKARLHPVHQVYKPHPAIDYAAPIGTPVWAAGDGEVIFAGWMGGLGNTVKVKHRNGFISYYGHLSKFGSGVKAGTRVKQKQIVGYVGRSGTATGPHLDYRLELRGKFLDPLKVTLESESAIASREYLSFERVRMERLMSLREANPNIVLEAAM